jgi:hypothetical protein
MAPSLLKKVAKASARQGRINSTLLAQIAVKAAEANRQREIARRHRRRSEMEVNRRMHARVQLALQGVSALCALGASPEFQSLLRTHGGSFVIWGDEDARTAGGDMSDVYWRWVSKIELREHELVLHNYTATSGNYGSTYKLDRFEGGHQSFMHFPYAVEDDFLRTRILWRIATPNKFYDYKDESREYRRRMLEDPNFVYNIDWLFEILVTCANSKEFEELVADAIK